jgi:predicted dienelactone hydrolase
MPIWLRYCHHLRNFAVHAFAAVALVANGTFAVAANIGFEANVGFEKVEIANGAEPPLTAGIWYPTDMPTARHRLGEFTQTVASGASVAGYGLPLVVLSHGGAGSFESHYDTALALAHAGFVAAAVSHAGDTHDDQSQVLRLWRRPAQLRRLISFVLNEWRQHDRIDAARVGAFGFSNGGFTVLVAAGGVPDLAKVAPFCESHPGQDLCQALRQAGVDQVHAFDAPPGAWAPDLRIKAAVVAAPSFGFAFAPTGLKDVHIPIQLWRAADDRHQPNPWYDEAVRRALPRAPDYHVVPGADHFDFLPPCGPRLAALAPRICDDPSGFDRAAFHQAFNAEIVRFFRSKLHQVRDRPAGRHQN